LRRRNTIDIVANIAADSVTRLGDEPDEVQPPLEPPLEEEEEEGDPPSGVASADSTFSRAQW
jgi:hypothetical protein